MLREIRDVRQVPQEPWRRWFTSLTMDLIVWQDQASHIVSFQFCYNKGGVGAHAERMVSWREGGVLQHQSVDDGERSAISGYKATPLPGASCPLQVGMVSQLFEENAVELPPDIRKIVLQQIQAQSGHQAA